MKSFSGTLLQQTGCPQNNTRNDNVTKDQAYQRESVYRACQEAADPPFVLHYKSLPDHTLNIVFWSQLPLSESTPSILQKSKQMMSAAYAVKDMLPFQPFHILLSDFSANARYLTKSVEIAYATDLSNAMVTSRSSRH